MRIVLASNNPDKLREVREILSGTNIEILSQKEAGIHTEPEETGTTFEENARIKALAAMRASGLPAVSDDSGICINALGSCPGVFSSRFLAELSYPEKCQRIMKLLEGMQDRRAHYTAAAVMVFPDGREITAEGIAEGEIAHEARGDGGFGYDPIFFLPEYGKTMAEISEDEKNALSHRGKAFRALAAKLREERN